MKAVFQGLFVLMFFAANAVAASKFAITINFTENFGGAKPYSMEAPEIIVESGQKGTINYKTAQYVVIPTLLENGKVQVEEFVNTQADGKKTSEISTTKKTVALDEEVATETQVDGVKFQFKTKVAKAKK